MPYLLVLGLYLISAATFATSTTAPAVLNHSELVKILTGLLLVLFVIFLLSWLIKRFNVVQLSSSKGFNVIASMTLGPKERILLIKVGARYLLIGIGTSTVNTLYDFGEQKPEGFDVENKSSFADLLKSTLRKSS
ncbi:flagellar biosynthetic protein FliO [Legionella sp. km772]|uniref:flagellar biosynthetic protein FliO n=1 Tax=Legionella sp. km772 TaxID=2498111 RepID=UPI000F8EA88B|nr:flagellar biosynthetic protein FliO [Legionella sp. km772]RUR05933.1 flagellar biosynthetic protein FliO [Legionella sp. km772]